MLRFSLGLRLRLLADDVQLVSTVNERRQLGSVDVRNFTQKSPANVIGFLPRQMISFGASVPVPLKGLLSHVSLRHGTDSNSHAVQVRAASKNNTCLLYCYSYRPT